ncbi:phosphatidylserine decarboxylase family protein [Geobacter argillaceus]|uniref:Phosphatidylserine decarboxylase proenzyme n=1 Tax=Geobacter argillaceus TaxID=345631 RepID=A0A562WRA2_9BACT|nr:phosphatidylserine decarboxylase family protein [Geobacter argillaceus]TWJ32939.1 phosphatidylserine decarboxylase [Geobacter argillaceus]
MRNTHTPIAVEGFPFIAIAAAFTAVVAFLYWRTCSAWLLALVCFLLLLTGFIVFFFRNPQRTGTSDERAVLAPADGVIVYLGDAHEEHLGQEMSKVSIFMSVFNVHVNRAPLTGRVVDTFYVSGKFLDVRDERATFENERLGIILETARGVKIVVVQVAGLIARRIVCYAKKGDTLERGRRYGLIRFGSRLDVYLPKGTEIKVAMGEKTRCGETVLGILP